MTLTTTVMVMETTGALQLIVPLMITVFVAKVMGHCCSQHLPKSVSHDDHVCHQGTQVLDNCHSACPRSRICWQPSRSAAYGAIATAM